MTVTRWIAYEGSGPLIRALVQALEDRGVAVVARRGGPHGQHRAVREMGEAVTATLVATGASEAIDAGVSAFRQRFANRAVVTIEDEERLPRPRGRHRA